jgi:hypothetical protein
MRRATSLSREVAKRFVVSNKKAGIVGTIGIFVGK